METEEVISTLDRFNAQVLLIANLAPQTCLDALEKAFATDDGRAYLAGEADRERLLTAVYGVTAMVCRTSQETWPVNLLALLNACFEMGVRAALANTYTNEPAAPSNKTTRAYLEHLRADTPAAEAQSRTENVFAAIMREAAAAIGSPDFDSTLNSFFQGQEPIN